MSETVREFLTNIATKEGWDADDDGLGEILTEGERVYSGWQDVHRWYIREQAVNEVEGRFIEFVDYIITGDSGISDMDLHYDLDNASFVEKKTREITETYYE